MTSDTPGPGPTGSDRPPEPTDPAAAPGQWPAELVPPPGDDAPAAPGDDAPTRAVPPVTPASAGTWGAPPTTPGESAAPAGSGTWGTTPSAGTWGSPPPGAGPAPQMPPVPQTPPSGWGDPSGVPDATPPGWGAPGAATPGQPPVPGQPGDPWGATPPPAGGWGVPPAAGQPPGQWGAPPQPGGWVPGPGVPGGPPGAWNPAPASSSGNGCLKACLIAGAVLVVIGILGVVALGAFASRIVDDLGFNPDGTFQECAFLTDADLDAALGRDASVAPLSGFVGDIADEALDDRILPDADGCWFFADAPELVGRVAVVDDAAAEATFESTRAEGEGSFVGPDMPGVGDEAFCTGVGAGGLGSGILVRSGTRLVFVSVVDEDIASDYRFDSGGGVMFSPATCELAARIAQAVAR